FLPPSAPSRFVSVLFSFFFSCYAHHRDLHSFPTRRSSDLNWRFGWRKTAREDLVWRWRRRFPDSRQDGASGRNRHWRAHQPSKRDRKSTRLNSSHVEISYAVFCLKKKKKIPEEA